MRLIIRCYDAIWSRDHPYDSLSYNAAALPGNLYVNNAINGLVELLAYLLCVALLDRLGRKVLLVGAMMLGGACCLTSGIGKWLTIFTLPTTACQKVSTLQSHNVTQI